MKFAARGLYELWNGTRKVSGHTSVPKAVESAVADSEATGATRYYLRQPTIEIDLSRLTRVVRDVDVTRPTTPTGLAATPISETRIDLSWNDSSDPSGAIGEAVTGISGYRVYRDGALRASQGLATTFSDTGLTVYTQYSYQVTAYDFAGNESVKTTAVVARTPDAAAPTTPGNLTATVISATQINLAWSAATDSGSGLEFYRIERSPDGSTWTPLLFVSGHLTTASDTQASPATRYYYRVLARDVAGNSGAYSSTVNAITPPAYSPRAVMSMASPSKDEGNSGTSNMVFTVHLSEPQVKAVSFTYATSDGTAIAGQDYMAASGSGLIPVGTTAVAINVPIIGDTVLEDDESFTLTLSNIAWVLN